MEDTAITLYMCFWIQSLIIGDFNKICDKMMTQASQKKKPNTYKMIKIRE